MFVRCDNCQENFWLTVAPGYKPVVAFPALWCYQCLEKEN